MSINLSDEVYITYKPYRLSFSEEDTVKEIINELKDYDIIRESFEWRNTYV